MPRALSKGIDWIQYRLDFRHWKHNSQFSGEKGLGRVAFIASVLSSALTFNLIFLLVTFMDRIGITKIGIFEPEFNTFCSQERVILIVQIILFATSLCIFHLLEFFVTALYNPTVVNASSFVVNHSRSYTIAMLVSLIEYIIRFFFFPSINSKMMSMIGIFLVIVGQSIRSLSMITCGESFNHIIQLSKKQNHVLVKSGIYQYLRHPSYFGFYYWSVGTQMMLGNFISTFLFAAASWAFFKRRIPYEEQTLVKMFPTEYPEYMKNSMIGIPFIHSNIKQNTD